MSQIILKNWLSFVMMYNLILLFRVFTIFNKSDIIQCSKVISPTFKRLLLNFKFNF